MVGFSKTGEVLVGEVAKRQAITNPERTIRSVKRHMGTSWKIDIDGKKYTAQEISARILRKLKRDAEAYLGDTVTQAVITVPAYFDDAQRTATKEAGQIAGLEVLRIINEPTAAALAYGLDKEDKEQTVLVFDLGGGTFDVSVLEIGEGVFEVKSTSGNTHLGGDDWDQQGHRLAGQDVQGHRGRRPVGNDKMAMQRLKEAAEKAKIELSSVQETQINLPFITATSEGPKHLDLKLTRVQVQRAHGRPGRRRARARSSRPSRTPGSRRPTSTTWCWSAARPGCPAVQDLVQSLTGKEPHKGVNPDEVVAIGAAVQAGVLKGEVKDVLLLDVTPLVARHRDQGRRSCTGSSSATRPSRPSGRRSSRRPRTTSRRSRSTCSRASARWPCTTRRWASSSWWTCRRRPAGVPQIEVTFDIDANGIVHVSAQDKATGKEQSMTITGQSSLAKDEIDRMVRDAEAHAEDDRRRREEAEVRNNADTLVYQTEKLLQDQGEKFEGSEKDDVEARPAGREGRPDRHRRRGHQDGHRAS